MNHPMRSVNQSVFIRRAVGNRAMPPAYRTRASIVETKLVIAGQRDLKLARLEAALWLADEPLTDRRLTTAAGLADVAETRQTIQRLREVLDADQSAFQVEELAGG